MKIENYLSDTEPKHSDMIDSLMFAFASQEAKLRDEYILLYVKKKPWYIPDFIYKWFLKKFLVLSSFKS